MLSESEFSRLRATYLDCEARRAELQPTLDGKVAELERVKGPQPATLLGLLGDVVQSWIDPVARHQSEFRGASIRELETAIAHLKEELRLLDERQNQVLAPLLHDCPREWQTFLPMWLARRRAQGRCDLCGRVEARARMEFHVHHVLARSQGGPNTLSNALFLCEKCHGDQPGPGHCGIRGRRRKRLAARDTRANLGAAYEPTRALKQLTRRLPTLLRGLHCHGLYYVISHARARVTVPELLTRRNAANAVGERFASTDAGITGEIVLYAENRPKRLVCKLVWKEGMWVFIGTDAWTICPVQPVGTDGKAVGTKDDLALCMAAMILARSTHGCSVRIDGESQ